MDRCSLCGATARLLHAGREGYWVVMAGQWSAWFDGKAWKRIECAGCRHLLTEECVALDPPEDPRITVSDRPTLRAQ